MAGEKCQVCGGKVVNGRCSLCGMPYRNDEALYHLNEPREVHYGHASARVREKMRGYAEMSGTGKTQQRSANGTAGMPGTVRTEKKGNTGNRRETAATVQRSQNSGSMPGNMSGQTRGNMQRGFGTRTGRGGISELNRQKTEKTSADMNQRKVMNQSEKQPSEKKKSGSKAWIIIWFIIGIICAAPEMWKLFLNWLVNNL